jgi:hypothetical protein
MPRPVVTALTLAAAVLMVAGCTPASSSPFPTAATAQTAPLQTTTPASVDGILVGPGPQANDTVQTQPAPGSCRYTFVGTDPLPDPHCTPGAVDPRVTQANIATTICSRGFASSVRPPERVTAPEKEASAAAYGYTGWLHLAEYDHLIPLELGGDPNDPANLWVEPPDDPDATSFANAKDGLEARLNGLVCSGNLPLTTAQRAIASDWVTAVRAYGG